MDAEKLQQIQAHARAIAALLYDETAPEQLTTLEGIEAAVRGHVLEQVSPEIGKFFITRASGPSSGRSRQLKSILGSISLTENQAKVLNVKERTQLSPYLEKCCLILSANVSYERSAQDIPILTGMKVSRGTQQRLVHRQCFELPRIETAVEEMSIDGGKVRIRTPKGEICRWQDYKAVNLHGHCCEAFLQDNEQLVQWVNEQPLNTPVTCLGDGHDGIWNLFAGIAEVSQRREILDWFHLVENLYKVGGSLQRLATVESLLWQGNVDGAIEQFTGWQHEQVDNFIAYLTKHRHRIVNYSYYQAEGISIGSGTIESTVKQISARIKLTGAQWKADNVPQVLLHRCAYLNGQLSL
ncbi:ISKra4 family transposase (plasmid) [Kovacikia minuta CCNUW1]|uniref:ISKra4 family transposase n=1 Tax=Kovacikia minuta TaxID=2931930 RepID=UPI001CCE52C1|nr:ISKra4 family transposase [Kovacikia minuta]UBF29528.1 ISKra4 family transposase [Kovacikia minuta CCNUW1]UBF29566.1 ISKra4 family transposase [Kovacikia minuta CCNUW1]UBF29616.1 ISKra4 family transposase [Kovacikia minuta CCNUW1]UBF29617.1 ISKra4 family transposase [Kovacikia minuta CCNUW1]UBF29704.1 ISKra4 family transposase [Kovacikia minuta CCNUW1]